MKTICVLNLKGGCAKTTTAVSMAELLAAGFERDGVKILKAASCFLTMTSRERKPVI